MNPIQWAYNKIKGFKTPAWLKVILQELQDLVIQICLQVGKEYIDSLKAKIVEVSGENISPEAKFKKVFDYAKSIGPYKDRLINLLIEMLVNQLKNRNIIG